MTNKNPQIEVHRRESESPASLMRRFSKKALLAGILKRVRAAQFRVRVKSKRYIRETAIRRKKFAEEQRYLKKIGKIKAKPK